MPKLKNGQISYDSKITFTGSSKKVENLAAGTAATDGINYGQLSGAGGAGMVFSSSQYNIAAADATITVNADNIQVGTINYSNIQNVAANNVILGNDNGAGSVVQELDAAAILTLINVTAGANNYVHPNHTGEVTSTADGAQVLAKTSISNRTDTTITASDYIIYGDASDSDNLKKDTVQGLLDLTSSIPALNNGQIFVGDASNAAASVAMSGDATITNAGVITIGADKVTYSKMQDVSQACMLGKTSAGTGQITEVPIIDQYISSTGSVATLLNTTSNWNVNGVYTGSTITGTYQGQSHYNGDYWFTAVADNTWVRLIRG